MIWPILYLVWRHKGTKDLCKLKRPNKASLSTATILAACAPSLLALKAQPVRADRQLATFLQLPAVRLLVNRPRLLDQPHAPLHGRPCSPALIVAAKAAPHKRVLPHFAGCRRVLEQQCLTVRPVRGEAQGPDQPQGRGQEEEAVQVGSTGIENPHRTAIIPPTPGPQVTPADPDLLVAFAHTPHPTSCSSRGCTRVRSINCDTRTCPSGRGNKRTAAGTPAGIPRAGWVRHRA